MMLGTANPLGLVAKGPGCLHHGLRSGEVGGFPGLHPSFPLWLFSLTFSASLLLYLGVFYVLSENVISLFPFFCLLKLLFVSKICWEHWRRKTLFG